MFDLAVGAFTFSLRLLAGLGVIALALAAVGIYSVVSTIVAERTREVGIRMALGSRHRDVVALVVRQGMRPAVLGLAIGLVAALGATRALAGLLVGVGTADPLAYSTGVAVLAVVSLAACYLPARRATRVDPVEALRHE
jgi:ABC-type antimicrobial peptide transport system permease subunit